MRDFQKLNNYIFKKQKYNEKNLVNKKIYKRK